MSVGRKMQPGSDYFHPFFEGAFYGFYSVSGSQPQVPSTSQQDKLSFEGVNIKGSFINYVDQILPNFDPLYPTRGQFWAGILHDT